jgi:hypothetical protein
MNAGETVNDTLLRMQMTSVKEQREQRQGKFMYEESGQGMYGGMYEKIERCRCSYSFENNRTGNLDSFLDCFKPVFRIQLHNLKCLQNENIDSVLNNFRQAFVKFALRLHHG